ncbi:MAG: aldehyde ferredoxin oxidoreductase family protein [Dehalococcoidia bacterium]|nr:aldehyde ferredoxin oxidoreductase family protein [Dehalococcoidia bacterium]
MHGWTGQRLKVYLTEGKIVKEPLPDELRLNYLGGRGVISRTLLDELKPGVDPLGPDNIFMVAAGPLNGTAAPCTSRWTVTAKSAITGGLSDGNGGGDFATELKFAGYDQIIFYGRSPRPVYLWISNDQVELRDASHLCGKTTKETNDHLAKELEDTETRVLCIGPAGENLVRLAKVFSNSTRAGGKGGIGAVMGSKNLKAVAVRGTGSVRIANPTAFLTAAKRAYEKLTDSPFLQMFRQQGTMHLIRHHANTYALPTKNLQEGYFEGWENLTWEAFAPKYQVKNKACSACPVACSHYYRVKDGPYATHGESNEYGTTYPFGSKCGIDNMAALLKINTICDMLGLDTHATGGTVSFAMECWQRGLLTAKDTDNLDLSWGNADAVIELLPKIAYRQGFGGLLADGSFLASKQIRGSDVCLRTVKGMEVSALFLGPRQNIVAGLGYATASRGADHLRGGVLLNSYGMPRLQEVLGSREAALRLMKEPRSTEGKGVLLSLDQDFSALMDSLEICCHVTGELRQGLNPDELAELFSSCTGVDMSGDDLMKVGERICNVEKLINLRAGMGRKADTLPRIFFEEKETPRGATGMSEAKFQGMLDDFYRFRGWDEGGVPTREKLEELGLLDTVGGFKITDPSE